MVSDNPFVSITVSDKDIIVDRETEKIELLILINETMEHGGVIVIKGTPGIGKSTLLNAVEKELKKSDVLNIIKDEFTPAVYNKIKGINPDETRKTLLILDDFNNIEMLDKLSQQRVIDLLYRLSQRIAVLLVENREDGIEKELKTQNKQFNIYEVKGLQKQDLKRIIINRLNSVRNKKTDSLEPFTEDEYNKIYKKSRGNSRIALLICSALYDQKTNSII